MANGSPLMAEPAGEQDEEVVAAARLTDDHVVPVDLAPRKSRWEPVRMPEEPSAEARAAERQAARLRFRAYCIACGRSTESATAPSRPGRCGHCGGTMLVEPVTS